MAELLGNGVFEIDGEIFKGRNHMAILRNLRNMFSNDISEHHGKKILLALKSGVEHGKQFPFRYFNAYTMIQNSDVKYKNLILDALEECLDIALVNLPKLPGKTVCLSDNSGSAHGSFASEYGHMDVAKINNLSSILTALNADEGEFYVFGDRLTEVAVSKRNGALIQLKEANARGQEVGMSTENGVWLYLDNIIRNKEHIDNLFIYSDMQAGHGGLYGINPSQYKEHVCNGRYIDVLSLVEKYRKEVNPQVNVFTVQTAGYSNVVLPENLYRTSILYGWTGKESVYAEKMIQLWDEADKDN